jgi:hypothetical protein
MTQLISDFLDRVASQHNISLPQVQALMSWPLPQVIPVESDSE